MVNMNNKIKNMCEQKQLIIKLYWGFVPESGHTEQCLYIPGKWCAQP